MPDLQNTATVDISPVPTHNIESVSEVIIPNDQIVTSAVETSITAQEIPAPALNVRSEHELQPNIDPIYDFKSLRPEEIKVPSEKPKLTLISAVANQRKLLRGEF